MEYSAGLAMVWQIAGIEARRGHAREIEPVHLLIGILKLCDLDWEVVRAQAPSELAEELGREEASARLLRERFEADGVDHVGLRRRLRALAAGSGLRERDGRTEMLHRGDAARRAFRRAEDLAVLITGPPARAVGPRHLLQALLERPDRPSRQALAELGVSALSGNPVGAGAEGEHVSAVEPEPSGAETPPPTPVLDRLGRDLTQLARERRLDPLIGRRPELRSLARALTQHRKSNAILVGEAGVGKTCIVEGLAALIVGPDPPEALAGKRLVEVSIAALVAGTKYRGEFEERVQALVEEASGDEGLIVFIDEIHTALGAGATSESALDAATILKPALARGELRCIGATTVAEYRRYVERDAALERRFQLIWVDEPTGAEALEILSGVRPRLAEHHGIEIADEAVAAAVELSQRYLPDLRLPDKAIDLIDQACASARIASLSPASSRPPVTSVGRAEVAAVVAERCRLPVERLTLEEAEHLLGMEDALRARVLGQDRAVRAVSEAIRVARAGLKDPRRPAGVFLFAGPTGTGKTELAKALAEFLFDDEGRLIRIDMSEYMEPHSVARLIGAPPGYVGHGEEGQLTGPVRTRPYSVVLLDEIEKAHPEVLDLFLQMFDEGQLTDARGRRASFAECVIVMTSNLGTAAPASPIGFAPGGTGDDAEARVLAALRGGLRPELLGRLGEIVVFEPLDERVVRGILDKLLDRLRARLADRRIELALSDAAYALLLGEGFAPAYGARELERVVERRLAQPLGRALLEGAIAEGDTVLADARGGELRLEPAERTRPARMRPPSDAPGAAP